LQGKRILTFDNIKPIDAVVVGMYPDQVQLNVGHTMAALGLAK
jgi:hypothetical protein